MKSILPIRKFFIITLSLFIYSTSNAGAENSSWTPERTTVAENPPLKEFSLFMDQISNGTITSLTRDQVENLVFSKIPTFYFTLENFVDKTNHQAAKRIVLDYQKSEQLINSNLSFEEVEIVIIKFNLLNSDKIKLPDFTQWNNLKIILFDFSYNPCNGNLSVSECMENWYQTLIPILSSPNVFCLYKINIQE